MGEDWVPSPFLRRKAEEIGVDPDHVATDCRDWCLDHGIETMTVGLWLRWCHGGEDSFYA
jgi:hypothetical protein